MQGLTWTFPLKVFGGISENLVNVKRSQVLNARVGSLLASYSPTIP